MRVTIRGGAEYDLPNAEEIRQIVGEQVRTELRGVKYMRMPLLRGTPSGNALLLGGDSNKSGALVSPEMGEAWIIEHLWVNGLTAGATPDVMNVIVNAQTWWQLNGNNFAFTFSKGQIVLLQGETLVFQNSGTLITTSQVTIGGAYWRVPGEMLAKLY